MLLKSITKFFYKLCKCKVKSMLKVASSLSTSLKRNYAGQTSVILKSKDLDIL